MAIKATIYKAELQISDMDRNYYHDHALTIARHPSETDERLMVRLLAFAMHADEALTIAPGLTHNDEPDICRKDLTGAIELWIDVGQPDEKSIRRACGRSRQVYIYTYSGNSADIWWGENRDQLEKVRNLTVINIPGSVSQALTKMAQRNMHLQCTIQDGQVWISDNDNNVQVEPEMRKAAQRSFS